MTHDSGAGDRVGCFRSRVIGVGPQVGFVIPMGTTQGYLNFKAYKDLDLLYVAQPMKGPKAHLPSLDQLRNNAAECIRLAEAVHTSAHKSFFIEMADRWLTLAERAEKAQDR